MCHVVYVYLIFLCNIRSIDANSPSISVHLRPLLFARPKLESIRNSRSTAATSDRYSPENRWTNQRRSCCVLATKLWFISRRPTMKQSSSHSAAVCTRIHLLQLAQPWASHLKHHYHPCSDLHSMDMQVTSSTSLKGRFQSTLFAFNKELWPYWTLFHDH